MIKKWINKNFKSLVLILLVVGMGFSVYTALGRTAGKISDPIGSWPSGGDLGYIGEPMDARLADSDLAGDESVYNLLGKIHEKAGGDGGGGGTCGTCQEYVRYFPRPLPGLLWRASATGCCETQKMSVGYGTLAAGYYNEYCKAPDGGDMTLTGEISESIDINGMAYFYTRKYYECFRY